MRDAQLPGHTEDLSAVTYCLNGEDHTIGNLLRHMLMQKCAVLFFFHLASSC